MLKNKKILFIILGIIVVVAIAIVSVFIFNKEEKDIKEKEIVFSESGIYSETKEYDKVTITSDGVELSNIKTKELIVDKEVGNGTVKLNNVEVTDNLEILGGGPNSVYINNSMIVNINIDFSDVRVVLDSKTIVNKVTSNELDSLEVAGEIKELILNKESVIKILENSKINELLVNDNMEIDVKANITSIKIANNLNAVTLEISDKVVIDKLLSNSEVKLNGLGKLLSIETNNKDNISGNMNLDDVEFENLNSYNITFNSNGGSNVNRQTVFENDNVDKPKNPSRDGYTFVEWQLNNKSYDFDSEVTKNITLNAVWKKNVDEKLITTKKNEVIDIEYETTYVDNENMKTGTTKVITEGIKGSRTITYEITTNSKGEEVSRKQVDEKIVKATDEVVHQGISDYNLNTDYASAVYVGETCTQTIEVSNPDMIVCDYNYQVDNEFHGVTINGNHYIYKLNGTYLSTSIKMTKKHEYIYEYQKNGVILYAYTSRGGGDDEKLTESLCEKYNITCGRW